MTLPFNIFRFNDMLRPNATYDINIHDFVPTYDFTCPQQIGTHIAKNTITMATYIIGDREYNSKADEDVIEHFHEAIDTLGKMMMRCMKMVYREEGASEQHIRRDDKTVVLIMLSHVFLRYAHQVLHKKKTYAFPGTVLSPPANKPKPFTLPTGGAIVRIVFDLVPQIPTRSDAAWASGCIGSLLQFIASGASGNITFETRPHGTKLSAELERTGYTRFIQEACHINAGKVRSDMEILKGYDWDTHAVVDGVRPMN